MAHNGDRSWFYFLRDDKGRPRLTVCLLWDHVFKQFHRGITLCSLEDVRQQKFTKKEGRAIAIQRAKLAHICAFPGFKASKPMCEERLAGYDPAQVKHVLGGSLDKVQWNVRLTDLEIRIILDTRARQTNREMKREEVHRARIDFIPYYLTSKASNG